MSEILWCEKFRPTTIDACALPQRLKDTFKNIVKKGELPNLILSGVSGIGKTTIARALCNEMNSSCLFINGSDESGIDTLRVKVKQFASTLSFDAQRKTVIFDEADHLNPNSTQPALRGFMEHFSDSCGFIFTVNYPTRIIDPLHSRCALIDFTLDKTEKKEQLVAFIKICMSILEKESVEYDKKCLVAFCQENFPDMRKILNLLQVYSIRQGKIDEGIIGFSTDEQYGKLVEIFKSRNYPALCTWIADIVSFEDPETLYTKLFKVLEPKMQESSVPRFVQILAEKQFWARHVAGQELNLRACLQEVMADCEFN